MKVKIGKTIRSNIFLALAILIAVYFAFNLEHLMIIRQSLIELVESPMMFTSFSLLLVFCILIAGGYLISRNVRRRR